MKSSEFGLQLRRMRERAGLSQQALAEQASISRVYVSLLERGKKSPTLDVFARLCKALDVLPSRMLQQIEMERLGGAAEDC